MIARLRHKVPQAKKIIDEPVRLSDYSLSSLIDTESLYSSFSLQVCLISL